MSIGTLRKRVFLYSPNTLLAVSRKGRGAMQAKRPWQIVFARILALGYGVIGIFFIAILFLYGWSFVLQGFPGISSVKLVDILVIAVYLGIIYIFVSLSLGFWKLRRYAYDAALFIHGLMFLGQLVRYFIDDARSDLLFFLMLTTNALVLVYLFFPSVSKYYSFRHK